MMIGQLIGVTTGKPSRHPYPQHMQEARAIAAEGVVLLKNEGSVLPLRGKRVALFGPGATDTVSCGTGSGFVFAPYTVLGDPHADDPSRASFNSQISGIFKLSDKDQYIAVADRWMPDALMTSEEVDVIYRAIASRSDKSIKVTGKEKMQMIRRMAMQVDTSIADYVWLPIRFEGDMPRIEWRDKWTPAEL